MTDSLSENIVAYARRSRKAENAAYYAAHRGDPAWREKRRQQNLAWRAKNPTYHRELSQQPHVNARNKQILAAFRKAHPEVDRAGNNLRYAVKTGKIVRPDGCEECHRPCKPEGAHFNYAEPLRVRWLCRSCHRSWDRREPKA